MPTKYFSDIALSRQFYVGDAPLVEEDLPGEDVVVEHPRKPDSRPKLEYSRAVEFETLPVDIFFALVQYGYDRWR